MAKEVTDEIRAQILNGTYIPKASACPIPPGVADCFGVWRDPFVVTCQNCLEFETCALQLIKNQNFSPRR